jgi:hypothetical protein
MPANFKEGASNGLVKGSSQTFKHAGLSGVHHFSKRFVSAYNSWYPTQDVTG